jgi:hypothetical protein
MTKDCNNNKSYSLETYVGEQKRNSWQSIGIIGKENKRIFFSYYTIKR